MLRVALGSLSMSAGKNARGRFAGLILRMGILRSGLISVGYDGGMGLTVLSCVPRTQRIMLL